MGTTLHTLSPTPGSTKTKKRLGRGRGSGTGKTSGKGVKGQKARSGHHGARRGFEGGQMPLKMRIPKRGFKNPFRVEAFPINVSTLEKSFDAGEVLCAGISGAGRGRDDIELQFSYRVRENKTISVEGFYDFDKLGWQYLWPRHYLKVQGTEKIVTQEIDYLVLADVYEEADFSVLE